MLLGIRVSLSRRCKWFRIRIVQPQKRKTCFIVGRSDGQLSVGSLSLDAFEHVLKRVVEEACAGSSGAVRERAGSVVSVDPSGVSGGRSKVPSNFAGSHIEKNMYSYLTASYIDDSALSRRNTVQGQCEVVHRPEQRAEVFHRHEELNEL